jgi:hypothetical protein
MTDISGVKTIVGLLETITSDGQLKTLALEVQRRCNRLQAERASAFREGEEVSWICRGRASPGVVQRVEGGKVLVKLAHGFVARVSPGDLRHKARPRQLLSELMIK